MWNSHGSVQRKKCVFDQQLSDSVVAKVLKWPQTFKHWSWQNILVSLVLVLFFIFLKLLNFNKMQPHKQLTPNIYLLNVNISKLDPVAWVFFLIAAKKYWVHLVKLLMQLLCPCVINTNNWQKSEWWGFIDQTPSTKPCGYISCMATEFLDPYTNTVMPLMH